MLAGGHDRTDAQASVNYWYPRVVDTFGRAGSERLETYRKLGLRARSNEELLGRWQAEIGPALIDLGLAVPTARAGR